MLNYHVLVQVGNDPTFQVFQTCANPFQLLHHFEDRTGIEPVLFMFCRHKPLPTLAIYPFARRVSIELTSIGFGDQLALP